MGGNPGAYPGNPRCAPVGRKIMTIQRVKAGGNPKVRTLGANPEKTSVASAPVRKAHPHTVVVRKDPKRGGGTGAGALTGESMPRDCPISVRFVAPEVRRIGPSNHAQARPVPSQQRVLQRAFLRGRESGFDLVCASAAWQSSSTMRPSAVTRSGARTQCGCRSAATAHPQLTLPFCRSRVSVAKRSHQRRVSSGGLARSSKCPGVGA